MYRLVMSYSICREIIDVATSICDHPRAYALRVFLRKKVNYGTLILSIQRDKCEIPFMSK